MTEASLVAQITGLVRSAGRVQPNVLITAESRLVEDLGIDSLDLVDLFLQVQDHFDIAIEDDDVAQLARVSDLAAYIAARRGSAAA